MIAYTFFTLLAALTAVYLLFLFRLRAGLRYLGDEPAQPIPDIDDPQLPFVTVLLPVRNEKAFVASTITSLRAQRYPSDRMEVLVLDDHSDDGSAVAAASAAEGDDRVRVLTSTGEGKKSALSMGVTEARGEVICTTDADCVHGEDWLRAMTAPFAQGADIVAGPVVYADRGSFFKRLQAMEFLGLMGAGAGFFGIGYPRLCNGANLAYRKDQFLAVSGYEGNESVHSGDDEFLLHKIVYERGGVARFVISQEALVRTAPAASVGDFMTQRVRWASKGREYSDGRFVSFLLLLFVYFLLAATAPVVAASSFAAAIAGLLFFSLKIIADSAVLYSIAALLRQPLRLSDLLAAEFLHPYYIVIVSLTGFFGQYTWKNRRVRNRRR